MNEGISITSLPSGEKLDSQMPSENLAEAKLGDFIYEPDTGVEKAQLEGRLAAKFPVSLYKKSKYTILTSKEKVNSDFLKPFKVLAWADSVNEARDKLKLLKAGKAILHGRINPDEYWERRNKLENGLFGTKILHVFHLEEGYIIGAIDL